MTAIIMPALMTLAGLAFDAAYWAVGSVRLQFAADAAAFSSIMTIQQPAFQSKSSTAQSSDLQAIVNYEANAAANKLVGTITTAPVVSFDQSKFSSISVTLTSQVPSFFATAFGFTPPVLKATAVASMVVDNNATVASSPCLLMLGTTGTSIKVDNSGNIIAANCDVVGDGSGSNSLYLDSGTISGSKIATSGSFFKSNSGSNTVSPTPLEAARSSNGSAWPQT